MELRHAFQGAWQRQTAWEIVDAGDGQCPACGNTSGLVEFWEPQGPRQHISVGDGYGATKACIRCWSIADPPTSGDALDDRLPGGAYSNFR